MNRLKIYFTMNPQKLLLCIMLFFMLSTFALTEYLWQTFITQPLMPQGKSIAYELKPKTSVYHLTKDLSTFGNLSEKKRYLLLLLIYLQGDAHQLKAGEYLLEGGVPPGAWIKKLRSGDVIWRRVTFLEGWNFAQIIHVMNTNPYLHHTLSGLTPSQIMAKLGYPGLPAEGQFFPDTYLFARGTKDIVILKKAFRAMQDRLAHAWQQRAAGLSYQTPYQALIAASMIEKESGFKPERPFIAGVLLNRWQKGIPLQIDSTVSYGLGGIAHLTKANLQTNTPYNTYLYKGWPPTPIAMPSSDAIMAALHPRANPFIYFVATGIGGHHFSVSLKAHHAAVVQYQLKQNRIHLTTSVMPLLLPRLFAITTPILRIYTSREWVYTVFSSDFTSKF